MAKNVKINNVTYSGVPSVEIPLADGSGNATFFDTSSANAGPAHVLAGYKAFNANGEVEGTASLPSISQDQMTKKLTIA